MKNIFFLLIVLLCIGCEDPEPLSAGIETPVSGRIYDNSNMLPLTGQKIVIVEYMKTQHYGAISPNYDFKGRIDSTYTDADGYFDFKFKTTGSGNTYRVIFEPTEDVESSSDILEMNKKDLGIACHKDFYGIQLYPLNLKITANNLSILPVHVTSGFTSKPYSLPDIIQNNVQVSYILYVDKNDATFVWFSRWQSGHDVSYKVELPASGTVSPPEKIIEFSDANFVE